MAFMEINILQLIQGAKEARGLVVVIDVFRAFSTACYLFDGGAEQIIPVEHVEEAFQLKEKMPHVITLGERSERKVLGFDFGNSPTHILQEDLKNKTIVMTTSSGTKGIVNATLADQIITGSFVNAGAIIRYIRQQNPSVVSFVCMGYECRYPTQEDTFLAEYLRDTLLDKETDFGQMKDLLAVGDGSRLLDPANHQWSPSSDFDLCLDLNRFDFVLKVERNENLNVLKKIKI
jgi:2-phosphosulfolactate phosphatase